MKRLACIGLWCLAAIGLAQVEMRVLSEGKPVGTATIGHRITQDGGKQVTLRMELDNGSRKVVVRQVSTYDKTGRPKTKFQEVVATPNRTRTSVMATITATGASAVLDQNGSNESKDIEAPKDAPLEDPSEFWFLRDQPRPGTTFKKYRFDLNTLEWKIGETKYVGLKEIKVGGQTFRAHQIVTDDATTYVDAKGLPLLVETKTYRLERKPAPTKP
jgi:hypothetical protein